ncbi:hypothetical protein [Dongia sp.]|uniref:hypothetical protein n=1 Tax=Dongia sp. TaxID=1977262 RepID=UPI0037504176
MDGFEPNGFFLRKFHYQRLEIENFLSGLGDAKRIRWAVRGLLAGGVVAVMPFLDWPADKESPSFTGSTSAGGLVFSAAGLALMGYSLLMMIRRANIKESTDNQRLVGRDGDPAP